MGNTILLTLILVFQILAIIFGQLENKDKDKEINELQERIKSLEEKNKVGEILD